MADDFLIARGDTFLDDGSDYVLPSPIPGVDDDRWTQFVRVMMVAPITAVSDSNELGMFEMSPRRLDDLGLIERIGRKQHPDSKRTVWVAAFVPPLDDQKFLKSPRVQYTVFSASMRDYADKIAAGKLAKDPGMSLSGALAILHRAGPHGLDTWASGERFPRTVAAYDRTAGVF